MPCVPHPYVPDVISYIIVLQYQTRNLVQAVCIVLCHSGTCIDLCNHYHHQDTELFYPHKDLLLLIVMLLTPYHPSLLETIKLVLNWCNFVIWDCYISGIKQYVTFGDWLISFIVMPLRSIWIVAGINSSFPLFAK